MAADPDAPLRAGDDVSDAMWIRMDDLAGLGGDWWLWKGALGKGGLGGSCHDCWRLCGPRGTGTAEGPKGGSGLWRLLHLWAWEGMKVL